MAAVGPPSFIMNPGPDRKAPIEEMTLPLTVINWGHAEREMQVVVGRDQQSAAATCVAQDSAFAQLRPQGRQVGKFPRVTFHARCWHGWAKKHRRQSRLRSFFLFSFFRRKCRLLALFGLSEEVHTACAGLFEPTDCCSFDVE